KATFDAVARSAFGMEPVGCGDLVVKRAERGARSTRCAFNVCGENVGHGDLTVKRAERGAPSTRCAFDVWGGTPWPRRPHHEERAERGTRRTRRWRRTPLRTAAGRRPRWRVPSSSDSI